MKNILKLSLISVCSLTLAAGCIQETVPATSYVTSEQAQVPGAFDRFVDAVTTQIAGFPTYGGGTSANDFGYPRFFIAWDSMGQDIVQPNMSNGWFDSFYSIRSLGQTSGNSQYTWTVLYKQIKSANAVIANAGDNPDDSMKPGTGLALFYRAYWYLDLAQMYASKPYTVDQNAETVPYIDEKITIKETYSNPRLTNKEIYTKIMDDLNKAEEYLAGVKRADKYTPDVSCVYGLKARAYLLMGDWANARDYAKKAQAGYTIMDEATYTSRDNGFNTPTSSWMLAVTFKSDNPCIQNNDADSSWGSWMVMEINPVTSGCGYAANYGRPIHIDRHLYETVPATDFRKKCFADFAIDEMSKEDALEALKAYTEHPDWIYETNNGNSNPNGGTNFKFRAAGGSAGQDNQYVGFTMAVPLMRVEEMYLIEAEAAGRLNESEGIALLTAFAKTRDASFEYGKHNEAYGNTSTSAFVNEVWWQRRIEFWGEGFATKDIKRLQKGIIRSYPGTNHVMTYRYNKTSTPDWMNFCIVQTETNYNTACTNNPEPDYPLEDSPEVTVF
ncbi:MAG: RagB/SusD family nutrient uptake outer membrane protein [Bacteroidales bacterium]|nr:RagB/SusD family nutrient uptake outer membrane protein [Bacteroidales bacterium]